MAGASLLTLLDDIASVLDDVALMTKIAAKKTTGVLGDDLALNAQQVSGVNADRELPVVWAVAKGSALNKLILVPLALLISAFVPQFITPLLMIGGAYLCYEGVEKLAHKFLPHDDKSVIEVDLPEDLVAFEKNKIKGAIRTDFVLSAEIVVIALGTVKDASFMLQALVVCSIAVLMTVGVYSLVAGIVKLDDGGLYLLNKKGAGVLIKFQQRLGQMILWFCPILMKMLAFIGTAAMFLVGGGILVHGLPFAHDVLHLVTGVMAILPLSATLSVLLAGQIFNFLVGLCVGALLLATSLLFSKLKSLIQR